MLTEQTLTFGDGSLHYARGPRAGPPLLFLHGVLRRWQDFLPLIPSLAARWAVHALDFRGHGRSTPQSGAYRVVNYVEDAVAFLKHSLDEPAVVYGHSLGAMVALGAAAAAPDCCSALILEDPPFDTMGARMRETIFQSQFLGMQPLAGSEKSVAAVAKALAEIPLIAPHTGRVARLGDVRDGVALRFAARCLKQVDPEVFVPIVSGAWLEGYHLDQLLTAVRCPVLLLQADMAAGGMLTDDDAEKLEARLPDCTRIKLEDVGHLIHWTQTEATLRLLVAYLESLDHEE
jgi:pimeloyl-ACP methyl ester carboxylesterase